MSAARRGKIASLPAVIREQVNQRLLDGGNGPRILAWLNDLEDVHRILDEQFGGQPVSPNNLSDWRKGGYKEWRDRRERLESLSILADYALRLSQATGASLTDGSAAIAGGKILELLEAGKPADIHDLIKSLTKLRRTDLEAVKSKQRDRLLQQNDAKLALETKRFQRQTAELFLQWYADHKAKQIAESRVGKELKMDQLILLMFGERPKAHVHTLPEAGG